MSDIESDGAAIGAIAIVGMAGRFPGAKTVSAHWANVLNGRDCVSHFADAELEDTFDDATRNDASFVKARPILEDVDRFDAGFFGYLSREAALIDPQQRFFLELAWEAFEDAGIDPAAVDGSVGVFAGGSLNTYFLKHVLSDRGVVERFTDQFQIGEYQMLLGAGDFVATRTAYKLGLKGPAVSVQTACSTSLTAICQAVQSLQLYHCDMALAGGVSITFPQKRGYLYEEGGMGAPDGKCRPFDAAAKGTVFGSGAGAVLLKRLEDAIADGDQVYAVIRGFGLNNDGGDKVGFTAPSVEGQANCIAAAHANAGIDPSTIGYIEAHGTATPLGDPIEFAGLVKAFRLGGAKAGQFCALGSVKANVGHLDAAAGVTGLISAALALRDKTLPPLLHFTSPNPGIDLAASPFYVNTEARPWLAGDEPRRAGVSSFGVGGTNAHIVLEEAPAIEPNVDEARLQIVPLSARTEAAVGRMAAKLADHLEASASISMADVAATLQSGRRAFEHRAFVVAKDAVEAQAKLRKGPIAARAADKPPVVFMFPGQGAQYCGMGRHLYETEVVYREWVDRGLALLEPHFEIDFRELLLADAAEQQTIIQETRYAQPGIFLVSYALAKLWMSRGIEPAAMIGHSIGELVAAALAGAISFEDALALVVRRGQLMQAVEPGAMTGVRLAEAELRQLLPPDLDIAALNAPALSVVAGPLHAIDAFEATLGARDVGYRRLHTSHAFHSRMMDGVVEDLSNYAESFKFSVPTIPYVSSLTGAWASNDAALPASYWARHCRETVRFSDALAQVTGAGPSILLEVGPGRALTTFALQGLPKASYLAAFSSLPDFSSRADELAHVAEAAGRLWVHGAALDWSQVRAPGGRRISLPTYAFEPERHWIEAPARGANLASSLQAGADGDAPQAETFTSTSTQISAISMTQTPDRKPRLISEIGAMLGAISGETPDTANPDVTFWDLGYDSLMMGQVAQQLRKRWGVKVTFRQIMSDYPTIGALAGLLDKELPPEAAAQAPNAALAPAAATPAAAAPAPVAGAALLAAPAPVAAYTAPTSALFASAALDGSVQGVIRDQLSTMQALMERQLQLLGGAAPPMVAQVAAPATVAVSQPSQPGQAPANAEAPASTPAAGGVEVVFEEVRPTRFNAYKPGATPSAQTSDEQKAFIDSLAQRYAAKTPLSKAATQANRPVLADPRTASGFRDEWKELVYPVVAARSKGSKIWDIDGNEYLDVVNGYGQTAFGHTPDFVVEAVNDQMAQGFAIGPQTPLAGEVATMFAEMTGHQRVTFCNTGSEAVMAAMRLARTVTGKEKIVCFDGDYHGQFDEVLVKPGGNGADPRAFPLAPGIPPASVGNMVVLPYGKPESLAWIKANIDEIAGVLIEPVQSRHPNLRPKEFVQELRTVTAENDSALIVDEVVTGFRVHPAGMQGFWGIKGDMATYGKVVGGGLPVGVLAGDAKFMDALDGGQWQFGDDSVPEVAPTFFAGTFVRHPIVLAAMKAVLLHLKEAGPKLQEDLGAKTSALVDRLNRRLEDAGVRTRVETFSSWFYFSFSAEDRLGSLFYAYMRLLGVHIMEGFPCFLTTTHSDADIEKFEAAFAQSLAALQSVGILKPQSAENDSFFPQSGPSAALTESPLTEPQKEIWMSAQLGDEASLTFNESFTLTLDGDLQEAAFARAFEKVIARHDALRSHFSRVGDRMVADPNGMAPLEILDFSAEADPQAALAALIDGEARKVFDLTKAPLVRAYLVKVAAAKWAFVFTAHHIVCDGWSCNVVLGDLQALYTAEVTGEAPELEDVQSYLAFATAEDAAGVDAETRDYWLDMHREPAPQLELPGDRPRPEIKSFRGATTTRQLDVELLKAVKQASAKQSCSLFATLLGAAQVLFGKLGGQDDVVIATPMAGQTQAGDDLLVGHCVNFLPVRARFDAARPFSEHMVTVRDRVLDASERQNYTYGALVRDLGIKRDFNRLPLTDLQFNLEKIAGELEMPGLSTQFAPNAKAFTNFDLFLNVIESNKGLRLDVDYNTDIYDEATIQRWLGHYATLLTAIAADPATPIKALPLMSQAEICNLRDELNATSQDFDLSATTLELFSAQAARTPIATAIADGAETLTYEALQARARRIARALVAEGIMPGGRVAIGMDRTASMVASMIAVWKAGCAYVPLDVTMPVTRLNQILDGADVAAVLVDGLGEEKLGPVAHKVLTLDALLARPDKVNTALPGAADADSAYVIFTSGSTGQPKGVEIPHRALTNFLLSMAAYPGFSNRDSIVAVTTVSFDISGLELFLPLIVGGRCVIADQDAVRTGYELVAKIRDEGATILQATPSLWRMLLEAGFTAPPGFKILCGGEPLPRDLADSLLATGAEVVNVYGPTETTIWSSAGKVASQGPITIGAPIANTDLHVLTPDLRLAPLGVAGELWIGGEGLAKGYFNRPDLTEAAFQTVSIEGAAPRRLYRTGDLAKRLGDGTIQHLGRSDQQIKLRGFRIEIEEVESRLREAPGVAAAAVALHTVGGEPKLVGYVVRKAGAGLDLAAVGAHMAACLPAYMAPSLWVELETLPMTANGKLDRKALTAPSAAASLAEATSQAKAAQTPAEASIAEIWAQVLGLPAVGVDQPFFSLGADSLQLFRIVARMNAQGFKIDARQLMKNLTVAEVAAMLDTPEAEPKVARPSIAGYKRRRSQEA